MKKKLIIRWSLIHNYFNNNVKYTKKSNQSVKNMGYADRDKRPLVIGIELKLLKILKILPKNHLAILFPFLKVLLVFVLKRDSV